MPSRGEDGHYPKEACALQLRGGSSRGVHSLHGSGVEMCEWRRYLLSYIESRQAAWGNIQKMTTGDGGCTC